MGRMKRMLGRTAGVKTKFVPMTKMRKKVGLIRDDEAGNNQISHCSVVAIQKFSGAKKSEAE